MLNRYGRFGRIRTKAVKRYIPNLVEFALIILLGEMIILLENWHWFGVSTLAVLIVGICWLKTAWFVFETSHQLVAATHQNTAYYKFLYLVGINMVQIVTSFAFDYFTLYRLNPSSFNGINPDFTEGELLFECFYFSTLNFSFFGYGDITPNNIPAKLIALTEITLAFMTVIFILSDFITLKESIEKTDFLKKRAKKKGED